MSETFSFVTTGSRQMGLGHSTRLIVLATMASIRGVQAVIVTDSGIVAKQAERAGLGCVMVEISQRQTLQATLESIAPTKVFIDVPELHFPKYRWMEEIWSTHLIVSRVGHDFSFFGQTITLIGENLREWCEVQSCVTSTGKAEVRSGRAWMILSENFKNRRFPDAHNRGNSLIIVHGGGDPYQLTQRTLRAMEKTRNLFKVKVLVGPAFNDRKEISELAAKSKHPCKVLIDEVDVAGQMGSSAIAVMNGGNVRYELCVTGTPFVALSFQQRQFDTTEEITATGVGINLGLITELGDQEIAMSVDHLWEGIHNRAEMSIRMRSLFDFGGAERILQIG